MSEHPHRKGEQMGLLPYQIRCPNCGTVQVTSSEQMVRFLEKIMRERDDLKEALLHLRHSVKSKSQINIDHAMATTSGVEREEPK